MSENCFSALYVVCSFKGELLVAIYKLNAFFEHKRYGWSETWYGDYANSQRLMDAAVTEFLPARRKLLGGDQLLSTPKLTAFRVSNILIQRDSLMQPIRAADGTNLRAADRGDNSNLALIVRCEDPDLYQRTWYLRGVPDEIVQGGEFVPARDFFPDFINFRDVIRRLALGMYVLDKTIPTVAINAAATIAAGKVQITTGAAHLLSGGNKIRIIKAPGTTGLKGVRTVMSTVDATNFVVGASMSGTYIGGGEYIKQTPTFRPIQNMQIMRVNHRDTGRPFDSPRGRRPRRQTA